MKKLKYFAVLMAAVLLVSTGCGKKLSAEERLETALNKLNELESFTVDVNVDAEAEGTEVEVDLSMKAEKDKKDEAKLYLAADMNVEADGEEIGVDFETYVLVGEEEASIYAYSETLLGDWYYMSFDAEDVGLELDFNDNEKVDMDVFKSIKEVSTKEKGLTKYEVKIDGDEVELEEDVKAYFYVDKKDNLVKIELDLTDISGDLTSLTGTEDVEFEKFDLTIELSKFNDTKVKLSDDAEDATELTEEDLETLLSMFMGGFDSDYDSDYDYDYDYDYEEETDEDWTAEDILDDIMLSGGMQCDSTGAYTVDFSNYNNEISWLEDTYSISRVTSGAITYNDSCEYEITTPFVIDGLTCSLDEYEYAVCE